MIKLSSHRSISYAESYYYVTLYHMAVKYSDNTAGEIVFNPTDQDFLGNSKVSSLNVNRPEVSAMESVYEKPTSIFGIRIIFMWFITSVTAIKMAIFGKRLRTNSFWFDGISTICRDVKDNSYSWRALEIIYGLPTYLTSKLPDRVALYWNGLENAKAVRNRLRLTKKILREEIVARSAQGSVKILSIASGSARAVIETLGELRGNGGVSHEFRLLDLDPSAIQYASRLASEVGIADSCRMICGSTTDMDKHLRGYRPDVIEMVGFLEYRRRDKAISLLSRLKDILAPGGSIIVSQVKPNREMYFLRFVMNWPMIYRTEKEFRDILNQSGYSDFVLYTEPTGIHMVCNFSKEV